MTRLALLCLVLLALAASLWAREAAISATLLVLTVVAGAVVWTYRRRLIPDTPRAAADWLLHGIAMGFLGTALVSVAWAVPWVGDAIGARHLAEAGREIAPPVSTIGRALIIWAGVCHLVAAQRAAHGRGASSVRNGVLAALVGTALIFGALLGGAAMLVN